MPELPEVEIVRRGLVDHVVGRRIGQARFFSARVARRHLPGGQDLADRLAGQAVVAACRRGKYLWLVLEPADAALIMHLGMSGQLLAEAPDAPPEKHLHATLDFVDGGTQLRFVDQRTFGGVAWADLVPDPWVRQGAPPPQGDMPTPYVGEGVSWGEGPGRWGVPASVVHIAPDPLESAFDEGAVVAAMRRRDSAVKRALLDQSLVSGIGNIYADEALWRAGVHGQRLCARMSKPTLSRILGQARAVMLESLHQGGTSFDALYVHVNGASGYFERSLAAYGQAGRPCARCGAPIRREPFMNRSSYSCPRCQPRPRPVLSA
ncbi:MAG: Fpg/Nei family DNA glycosylase [Dermatophilaceae bacterium]